MTFPRTGLKFNKGKCLSSSLTKDFDVSYDLKCVIHHEGRIEEGHHESGIHEGHYTA